MSHFPPPAKSVRSFGHTPAPLNWLVSVCGWARAVYCSFGGLDTVPLLPLPPPFKLDWVSPPYSSSWLHTDKRRGKKSSEVHTEKGVFSVSFPSQEGRKEGKSVLGGTDRYTFDIVSQEKGRSLPFGEISRDGP